MAEAELLPIKVVIPRNDDYHRHERTGSRFRPLVNVTPDLRNSIADQIGKVIEYFSGAFAEWPRIPAVARVTLRPEAYAKTKRPVGLFNARTCPIIGGNRLGELYVGATARGLHALRRRVVHDYSDTGVAHISTISAIDPFRQDDVLGQGSLRSLRGQRLRLRLFRHGSESVNQEIDAAAHSIVSAGGQLDPLDYPSTLSVWEVKAPSSRTVATLASFPGTQCLSRFPTYKVVRTAARVLETLPGRLFPPPRPNVDYPLVGIIDTGTDPTNPHLQAWVARRWDLVPQSRQNSAHASFVAGLVCHSRLFNHDDSRFPSCSARIADVAAFDENGEIEERELMSVIRDAVAQFPEVKVWNLSFSITDRVCQDHEFSPIAMLLDELAKEEDVVFVIAAGNTEELATWPRTHDSNDKDRICSPADSPTSVVVGAIAHRDTPSTCVRKGQPSPFTRRGPSVAYLISPQLAHIGGNCTTTGDYAQTGILSVDGGGNLAEDIGTSFAAPPVACLAANVEAEVAAEPQSGLLARALLFHSTLVRNAPLDLQAFDHTGVGRPPDLKDVLHCRQSAATIVLRADLGFQPVVVKQEFPLPPCLVEEGSLRGEVLMTLVYLPPFDANAGFEYCQTNVEAKLGTVHPRTGKFENQIPTCPRSAEDTWEEQLVKYGYKWSPIKFYYRGLLARNTLGARRWQLQLILRRRAGLPPIDSEHVVYLLITLRDDRNAVWGPARVYDEMVQGMTRLGWGAVDLRLRSRERFRA